MNTNFTVIGLTHFGIKPESTALEADVLTTRPSELLIKNIFSKNLFLKVLDEVIIISHENETTWRND